jgi:hypothetical protein
MNVGKDILNTLPLKMYIPMILTGLTFGTMFSFPGDYIYWNRYTVIVKKVVLIKGFQHYNIYHVSHYIFVLRAWNFSFECKIIRTVSWAPNGIIMPRPFSADLRWRMVFQRLFYARTYEEIAANLFVSPKTVQLCICRTFYSIGDVSHCCLGLPTQSVTLFPHEEYIIMESLLENPKIQLH